MTSGRFLVLTGAIVLALSGTTWAGTYEVTACGDATSGLNNSWAPQNSASATIEAGTCTGADSGGLYVRDALAVPDTSSGADARWTFVAPTDAVVQSLSLRRWLHKSPDNNWEPSVRANGVILETCNITVSGCDVGTTGGQRRALSGLDATTIDIGLRCLANPSSHCGNGGTIHAAVAVMYGATVTIEESTRPLLTGVGGPLVDPTFAARSRMATFSATDNTGIRAGRIYVDGALGASATYACDFTYAVPCSNKTDAEVSLDTRSLTDGPHSVQVAAVDPAGNETLSAPRSIVVDNGAPFAPASLSVDGGADWRSTNSFDVSWVNPADSGAPVTSAHYVLCAVDGSGCLAEQETAGSGIDHLSDISVPSPGAWALRVWLEDGAGNVDSANAAELTLRYGSDPAATTSEPSPPSTEPSVDPAPAISDPLTPPSLDPTPAPTASTTATRLDPRLRLTSARLIHGRLLLRGRAATTAAGPLTLTIRARRGHSLRRHITIRGGRFSVVVRTRKGTRPRSVLARFAGTPAFRPATASLRLRG